MLNGLQVRMRRNIQAQNINRALSLRGQCWFAKLDIRQEMDLQGTYKELGSPSRVPSDVCVPKGARKIY